MKNISHAINEVLNILREISIDANGLITHNNVQLTSKKDLEVLSGIKNCIGLAIHTRTHIFFKKYSANIYILDTLNRPQLESVLAHEIFHIYSGYNGLKLEIQNEEGSAELASYYVYQRIGEHATSLHQESMLLNSDEIYGDGFRKVLNLAKQIGGIKKYFNNLIPKPKPIIGTTKLVNKFDLFWKNSTIINDKIEKDWWHSQIEKFPTHTKSWWKY